MSWVPEIEMEYGRARTVAQTALIALMHWHGNQLPPDPAIPEVGEAFKVYVGSRPVPGGGHPLFMDLCVAACERQWNKAPALPEGTREEQAVYLLKWLRKHGDLTSLKFNGKEYDPAEFTD